MEIRNGFHGPRSCARGATQFHVGAFVGEGVGRENAHQSAHRIAAVERTLRAAKHVNARHVEKREIVGRLVDIGDVVDIEADGWRVDARTDTADIDGRREARTIVTHEEIGREVGHALDALSVNALKGGLAEERHGDGLLVETRSFFRRGHHHCFVYLILAQGVGFIFRSGVCFVLDAEGEGHTFGETAVWQRRASGGAEGGEYGAGGCQQEGNMIHTLFCLTGCKVTVLLSEVQSSFMGRFRGGAEGGKFCSALGNCENTEEGLFCFSVKGLRIGWKNVILQLDNKRCSSNSSGRNIQQRFLHQMIRENANETIPINSFQQQAQMNLSNTYPETPSAHTLKTNKK